MPERESQNQSLDILSKVPWWKGTTFRIYLSHTLSSWGDRMWSFAVGLYMVILYPDSLLLTAIYGFSNCLCGIIFGPYIGERIDRTERITAARYAMVIQNGSVILGAIILAFTLHFHSDIKLIWNGRLEYVLYAVIILVALVAEMGSVASKIALEKDWIVVLAEGNEKKLARLNATMRTINLTTSILAPIVVGQIIHFGSQLAGAVYIAVWNLFSAVAEYYLLYLIYSMSPQLRLKGRSDEIPFVKICSPESDDSSTPHGSGEVINKTPDTAKGQGISKGLLVSEDGFVYGNNNRLLLTPGNDFEDVSLVTPVSQQKVSSKLPPSCISSSQVVPLEDKEQEIGKNSNGYFVACKGWKSYFSHHVKFAGLGLACLYMTVLGFDSITTGFVYSQGVNESLIGILTAVGAVFGILGSLSFPILRRKLGKNKTGILGFSLETLFLLLCVGSVFASGSPFKPRAMLDRFENVSGTASTYYSQSTRSLKEIWTEERHVILLLVGIIIARYGLWIADLSVTQIFQEEVQESQRGIINGVQDSLNKLMDLLKFALVILLPSPETFGYLIFVSWLFVFLGCVCFVVFSIKDRTRRRKVHHEDHNKRFGATNNDADNISTISDRVSLPNSIPRTDLTT